MDSSVVGTGGLEGSSDFRSILDALPYVIARFDRELRYLYVNAAIERATGQPASNFLGKTNAELGMPEALCALWASHTDAVFASGSIREFEFSLPTPDGDRIYHTCQVPEYGEDGAVMSVLGVTQEITDRWQRLYQAEADIVERDAILRSLYDSSPMMMGVLELQDQDLRHITDNRAAAAFFGGTRESVKGTLMSESGVSPQTLQGWIDAYRQSERSGVPQRFECLNETSTGTHWLSVIVCSIAPVSEGVARFSYIAEDVTERKRFEQEMQSFNTWLKQANQQMMEDITFNQEQTVELARQKAELEQANAMLVHLAMTDSLTGLKNHRAFQERLEEELKRVSRYYVPSSILMIDVDHFKRFNDAFGHPAGDQVLQQVAFILQSGVRETDVVARYGGEEFVILMPHTELATAVIAAERIRIAIGGAKWLHDSITVSIGVSTLRSKDDRADLLIQRADQALYRSKAQGRNRVTSE